ncbi:Hypothetical predicted protein, partial [Pelobates cultripes]
MAANHETIDFLDVRVYTEGLKLAFTLYTKPTDRNTLLHTSSFLSNTLKASLPYSQFLRVYRNNSKPSKTQEQMSMMWGIFIQHGYKKTTLNAALQKYQVRD